jgi:acetyl esterase/lipase
MNTAYLPGLLLLVLTVASCKTKENPEISLEASSGVDIAYGSSPGQKMDYFLPASRSEENTKVLVLIHGGAWSAGDKADFNSYIDSLKRRMPEYAIFNINYRLATTAGNNFPTQENDVKSALDFIYKQRSEFNVSDKFVLMGASAGGHLALLQAYKHTSPFKVQAVVNFFGPSDMSDMFTNPPSSVNPALIALLVGGTPTTNAAAYFNSSPINFVSAQSPPTLTFQGGLDPLVRPSQQTALHAKLQSKGVINKYVLYPGEYHGWYGLTLSKSFEKIESFLDINVK